MIKNIRIQLLLFLLFFITYVYFIPKPGWNDFSRLDLVYSIVEQKSLNIDKYHENTGDKAYYKGHYYSDKAIGSSLLAVPVYVLLRPVKILLSSNNIVLWLNNIVKKYADRQEKVNSIVNSILFSVVYPFLLTIIVISFTSALFWAFIFYDFLTNFTKNIECCVFLTLTFAFGTTAFPYSIMFYSHQISAILVFTTFYLLFKIKEEKKDYSLLCGFLLGYLIITEYPTAIIVFILSFYFLKFTRDKKNIAKFIIGFLPPLFLLFIYNYLCFDNPFAVAYKYAYIEKFRVIHHQGIMGIGLPNFKTFWMLSFFPNKSLFFLSPFLLFVIPGFYYFFKKYKEEFYSIFFIFISYLLFFSGGNDPYMQWMGASFGHRHLLPMCPLLGLPIIVFLEHNNKFKKIFYLTCLISIIFFTVGVAVDMTPSTEINNLMFTYIFPNFFKEKLSLNFGMLLKLKGLYSLIPLAIIWIVFFILLNNKIRKNYEIH